MASVVETSAGTVIAIAAEQPLTFDASGYADTGMDWTDIAEITDGGETGREYAEVTHMPLSSRTVQKFKGSRNAGEVVIQLADDWDDAGQVIAEAALDSDNDYSFRITHPGGDITYFQGQVRSFKHAIGGVDSLRTSTITIGVTGNSAGVDYVRVPNP